MENNIIERIENEIDKLNNMSFNILFYVPDAKNNSNGYISYIYQMAQALIKLGYNVKMIYNLDNEYSADEIEELERKNEYIDENRIFEGVKDSLGDGYSSIEHINISKSELNVSPSDFLIIPEVFSQVMNQTKKLACKRIVLAQNFDYLTDFIPLGVSWANFGITDVIASTEKQSELVKSVFPFVKTNIINPYIPSFFYNEEPKKLVINLLCKNQKDINKIIKPFYWKYPMFKWVSFRDLRGFPRETFADILREGAITIWVDEDTQFGYSALEAMKSGSIVIGKIPKLVPEWMEKDGKLLDNALWFDDITTVHKLIAEVVYGWMRDEISDSLINEMKNTSEKYQYDKYYKNVEDTFKRYVDERKKDFEEVLIIAKNETK